MQIPVYNQEGKQVRALEISDKIFAVAPNPYVLHEAVVAQMANSRVSRAHTKMRGEVRGGGKKPWKQKGTGRARHGSIRSPLWRGGGITFGPRNDRNYSKKINSKVKRAAILMALSDKVAGNSFYVLDSFASELRKTKDVANILNAFPRKRGRIMLALPTSQKSIGRLAANIKQILPISTTSLNVVDLLNHANLITTVEGVRDIERIYKCR